MKKSKYQQCFYCFIFSILISYAFWFSYQQNIVTISISAYTNILINEALIRGETLIRVRRLFQCRYGNVRRLLEEILYLQMYLHYKHNITLTTLFINRLTFTAGSNNSPSLRFVQTLHITRTKIVFKMKQTSFFLIFTRLSLKQLK